MLCQRVDIAAATRSILANGVLFVAHLPSYLRWCEATGQPVPKSWRSTWARRFLLWCFRGF